MSFTEPIFLIFLPVTVLLYRFFPKKARWALLLAASLLFYAWHSVYLLGLLIFSVLVSYGCARSMTAHPEKRRQALGWALAAELGLLAVFKYLNFLLGSAVGLWNLFGGSANYRPVSILLPMGISFYTFQTLSYVLDVYHGKISAEKHLGYYALFVTFFPQLVAGPIERPEDLLPQLHAAPSPTPADRRAAMSLLLRGYAKKLLIADYFAQFVDRVYGNVSHSGGMALALATVLFASQIYGDFSGYSDIAQGCARLLGIRLSDNFRTPYAAKSIREFWRRWHRSLTGWFTDYLYIPLGGSRAGNRMTCRNILLTFLVSGLWHGANWTFVLWGGLHGVYLILERFLFRNRSPGRLPTFLAVCLSWVFFRSPDVATAFTILGKILTDFSLPGLDMGLLQVLFCAVLLGILFLLDRPAPAPEQPLTASRGAVYFFGILTILFAHFLLLTTQGATGFLYFQF